MCSHTLPRIVRLLRLEHIALSRWTDAEFALRCAGQVISTNPPGSPRDRAAVALSHRARASYMHWRRRLTRIKAAIALAAHPAKF